MAIKRFKNGSVLMTGNDMMEALAKACNRRNNYDRSCVFCKHEYDDSYCDGCPRLTEDDRISCSCHINPPCSLCTDLKFEPSQYLINYKHYRDGGKWKWECFKSTKEIHSKLSVLESKGICLSAETLSTGEITIYLGKDDEDDEIKFCGKGKFKDSVCKMILENS